MADFSAHFLEISVHSEYEDQCTSWIKCFVFVQSEWNRVSFDFVPIEKKKKTHSKLTLVTLTIQWNSTNAIEIFKIGNISL